MDYYNFLNTITSKSISINKYQYFKHNYSKYIPDNKNIAVLEIGPGLGEFVDYLNIHGYNNIDIVDNDINIINNLKKKFKLKRSYHVNNIDNLKLNNNYDIIMLSHFLEHITINQAIKLIKKLYISLNKSGVIIITTPNIASPFMLYSRYYDIGHIFGYNDNNLAELSMLCNIPSGHYHIEAFKIPPSNLINIFRIFLQHCLNFFILITFFINGGVYPRILTPFITLVIRK